ncbi:MAG: peptide chain release factor N(5)-glutamine methyltransferase [Treponema sp.]|nr:peptide chain release factor N(5)-glutamine methyltransferase [Treponema sp.]
MTIRTIRQVLSEGKRLLRSMPAGASNVTALDAGLLLGEVLCKNRTELLMHENDEVSEADSAHFFSLIQRRLDGECVAYILGRKEFRGLEFAVNRHVLVPRPDTETLVEAALELIDRRTNAEAGKGISVFDLCTGSGAAAISLKSERPFLTVTASDISAPALETARLNAARLLPETPDDIRFVQSDLFDNFRAEGISCKFDIIVSNPPYICSNAIAGLAPEVRGEPHLALDGGEDGLDLIRKIIAQAGEYLAADGWLFIEADPAQMLEIEAIAAAHGFGGFRIFSDLSGKARVFGAELL